MHSILAVLADVVYIVYAVILAGVAALPASATVGQDQTPSTQLRISALRLGCARDRTEHIEMIAM